MEKIAEKLSFFLASKSIIENENIDFYRYVIECLLIYILNFLTIFCFSIVMGKFMECIFFLLVFSGLRTYSGGIHMKTWYSCYIISCCIIIGIVNLIYVFKFEKLILLAGALSTFTVWKLAPCEDEKHKMEENKLKICKRKAKFHNSVVILYALIFEFLEIYIATRLCVVALMLNLVLLLAGYIKRNKLYG